MEKQTMKIVFFSDLHYAAEENKCCPNRFGEFGISLLARFVKKVNQEIQPDMVLCGGDLINDPKAENACRMTAALADVMALIKAPCLTIRGNHDLSQALFTKYFPFQSVFELGFLKITAFDDPETPDYNACRTTEDIKRMQEAANGWNGLLYSFQHTPLTPPCESPYHYENAREILKCMRDCGYRGTLSGHFHCGLALREEENLQYFIQSALCEKPFSFSILNMDRTGILSVKTESILI